MNIFIIFNCIPKAKVRDYYYCKINQIQQFLVLNKFYCQLSSL
jgi:hypothetical protein